MDIQLVLAICLASASAYAPALHLHASRPAVAQPLSRPVRDWRGAHALTMSLVLTEENCVAVLSDCEKELGTLFGTNDQSRKVGITGRLEFVELDGPIVVVRLSGRFWHKRSDVLMRVSSYVLERIPEVHRSPRHRRPGASSHAVPFAFSGAFSPSPRRVCPADCSLHAPHGRRSTSISRTRRSSTTLTP